MAEVTVCEPHHPLFGRRFRVLRRLASRAGNVAPSFEVEHEAGGTLLVPVAACEPHLARATGVKLSVEGLRELVSLAEALDAHVNPTRRSLGDAAAGAAPAHCRGRRRGSGGGAS